MRGVLYLLAFLLCISFASASYISMQTDATIASNQVTVNVSNLGDEASKSVQISAELNSQKKTGAVKDILGIMDKTGQTFTFDTAGMNGAYPLVITVDYADMNSYPFSSVTVSQFFSGNLTRSEIAGMIDPVVVSDQADIVLKLKNTGTTGKKLSLKFVVPKELTLQQTSGALNLDANSEGNLKLNLKKFSALAGSTYFIYALIEYDENGMHYSSIVSAKVSVVDKKNILWSNQVLVIAAILAVGAFIYFQFKKK
jgi:hypothetical protein